jgi:hypothetical protein
MISKNNRQNSNFQILHFLVGSCHTPDAAYALLCDLKEDRERALSKIKSADLWMQAKILKLEEVINNPDSKVYEVLEAKAELIDIENEKPFAQKNIDAAYNEFDFIQKCMSKLEPHRKYAHLSLPEAHQAMQKEEWCLELKHRAENFLLTEGRIPHDQFSTMRQHPDFNSELLPFIESTKACIQNGVPLQSIKLLNANLAEKLLGVTDAG